MLSHDPSTPKLLAPVNMIHLKAKWDLTVLLSLSHGLFGVSPIHLGVEILYSGDDKVDYYIRIVSNWSITYI